MLSNAAITSQARKKLAGNWLTPIFAFIIFIVAYIVFAIVVTIPLNALLGKSASDVAELLLELFFVYPVYIGITLLFYNIINTDNANIADIFRPVVYLFQKDKRKVYCRNLRALLLMGICCCVLYAICFIPSFFFYADWQILLNQDVQSQGAAPVALPSGSFFIAMGISMILCWIATILFAPAINVFLYKLVDDESINAVPVLKLCYKATVGNRYQYWCLCFRFVGWMLLCCLTFGIAFIWVGPYFYTSITIFCKELFNSQNSEIPAEVPAEPIYVSAEEEAKEKITLPEE